MIHETFEETLDLFMTIARDLVKLKLERLDLGKQIDDVMYKEESYKNYSEPHACSLIENCQKVIGKYKESQRLMGELIQLPHLSPDERNILSSIKYDFVFPHSERTKALLLYVYVRHECMKRKGGCGTIPPIRNQRAEEVFDWSPSAEESIFINFIRALDDEGTDWSRFASKNLNFFLPDHLVLPIVSDLQKEKGEESQSNPIQYSTKRVAEEYIALQEMHKPKRPRTEGKPKRQRV